MKFSDHFFTYNLLGEFNTARINDCCYNTLIILDGMLFTMAFILLIFGNKIIRLIVVAVLIVANIIFYSLYKCLKFTFDNILRIDCIYSKNFDRILYKCLKFTFDNILRIDCIYSKNFDRIFIGLVKYTKTKYVNTFEYQMDNIDRFILENGGNNRNRIFNLKVVFKNNDIQQICTLRKKTKADLEGLIYLLNERLNINANTNITPNNNFDTNEKNKDKN